MTTSDWQLIVGIVAGIGLAAASGFRVFVPLLVLSIAAKAGVLSVAPSFAWIASTPALVALCSASMLEVGGYYIPWLDHALDTIAAPAAIVAGTLSVASQAVNVDPWVGWVTGIIAGGGAAALVQTSTMMLRGVSLVTTGGIGNPIVSTVENVLAVVLAVLAVLVPIVALLALGVGIVLVIRWRRSRATRFVARRASVSEVSASPA
jgi:hypothetical protein